MAMCHPAPQAHPYVEALHGDEYSLTGCLKPLFAGDRPSALPQEQVLQLCSGQIWLARGSRGFVYYGLPPPVFFPQGQSIIELSQSQ